MFQADMGNTVHIHAHQGTIPTPNSAIVQFEMRELMGRQGRECRHQDWEVAQILLKNFNN
jgi:hypothetical protein